MRRPQDNGKERDRAGGFRSGRFPIIVTPWGCGSRRPTAEWCFVPES